MNVFAEEILVVVFFRHFEAYFRIFSSWYSILGISN